MLYEALRREIGPANYYEVSSISKWCIGMLGSLSRAAGPVPFEDLSYRKQHAVIRRFVLQNRYTNADARRAARLAQLYLTAVAEGDEDLADEIYAFMAAHAETMLRRWRRQSRQHWCAGNPAGRVCSSALRCSPMGLHLLVACHRLYVRPVQFLLIE